MTHTTFFAPVYWNVTEETETDAWPPTFWYPMENGEVWVAVAYDGRVRVADPVPEARTFQKETGFQLLAARVNPTNVLVVQVVLTVKVYCVTVWLPDCHDPTWVWVSWT